MPMVTRHLSGGVAAAILAAVAGAILLVLGLPSILRRAHAILAARALFDPLARNPYRRNDLRLTYALADRYHPLSVLRKEPPPPQQHPFRYSHVNLARLERGGDQQGIAAAYALAGDLDRARQILEPLVAAEKADGGPGNLAVDLAAVLASKGQSRGRAEALRLLDGVLRRHAAHPQGMWNRAVLLEQLDLPVAAARQFQGVADLGEPGWADEAQTRAARLQGRWDAAVARERAAQDAADELARTGKLPSEELARAYPDKVREGVYRLIRTADPSPDPARVLAAARQVDEWQEPAAGPGRLMNGDGPLVRLAMKPELEREIAGLLEEPLTLEKAQKFQKVVTELGDGYRQIKAWSLIAESHKRGDSPADGRDALEKGLQLATAASFPEITLELKTALSQFLTERRELQRAQQIALSMKRESQVRALPRWEVAANDRLRALEDYRFAMNLARAYVEENARQDLDTDARWYAQHQLALQARLDNEVDEARDHLRKLQSMPRPPGSPPFDYGVAAMVQELIQRGATKDWPEALTLLQQTLAHYQAHSNGYRRAYLPIIEGRLLLANGDRTGGRRKLEEAIRRVALMKDAGSFRQRIEAPAFSALAIDAALAGEQPRAFDYLAKMRGMTGLPEGCLLGVVEEHQRRFFVVRGFDDQMYTEIQELPSLLGPRPAAPLKIVASLTGCESVAVLATGQAFGQPRLLPGEVAWNYVHANPRAAAGDGLRRRLVVTDVRAPEELELPRLAPQPTTAGRGEEVIALVGWEATPSRVLAEMPRADEIDLHVHGVLLPQTSDVPALVFSPDASGDALLTVRDLADGLKLPRHPAVILGACHAARGAPYGSVHASLPAAFMAAGARMVFAAASPIEDSEAGDFFEGVRNRMEAGQAPAVALRDERLSPRWLRPGPHWTQDIVLFL
jgi:cellulose synthase operon protein C